MSVIIETNEIHRHTNYRQAIKANNKVNFELPDLVIREIRFRNQAFDLDMQGRHFDEYK